jgi:ketosteroid isomerase-like protein
VHANETLLRNAYVAMSAGDGRSLAKLLTADTTWVIAERESLAGVYTGPDDIFGLWRAIAKQTGGGLRLDVQDVLANNERGVVLVTARGERNGRQLDERQVAVFEFGDNSTVVRATSIYEDPDEYDTFWSD